jgi:hypothetical protein
MDDKSRDFRGEWKTRSGYATITKPQLDSRGNILGWVGKLFLSDGRKIHDADCYWWPSGCSKSGWDFDLVERKRGNETNWPNLNV